MLSQQWGTSGRRLAVPTTAAIHGCLWGGLHPLCSGHDRLYPGVSLEGLHLSGWSAGDDQPWWARTSEPRQTRISGWLHSPSSHSEATAYVPWSAVAGCMRGRVTGSGHAHPCRDMVLAWAGVSWVGCPVAMLTVVHPCPRRAAMSAAHLLPKFQCIV